MVTFLTGGSGHLGANLVRRLVADGQRVRALVVPGHDNRALDGLDVERVEGDVRDADRMNAVLKGCDRVFHTAAKVSTLNGTKRELEELYGINVMGTRHVLEAARRAGVARVVVTSSLSAVGYHVDDPHRPADESMPHNPFAHAMPYGRTKALCEHECLSAVAAGLDVVMVVSTGIVGPNDWLPSRTGGTIIDMAKGKLRAYVPGGVEFVAANDIVQGHVLAMEKGRTGHRYIVSTSYHTLDEMLGFFEAATGRKRPWLRIPPGLMLSVGGLTHAVKETFFPRSPQRFTPQAIRLLQLHRRADTTKARTELGFVPTSVAEAVNDAVAFFRRVGMIPSKESP